MQLNMWFSGEIYTADKKFTLPPAVTGVTNMTLSNKGPPLMLDLNTSLFGFAVAGKLSKSLVL